MRPSATRPHTLGYEAFSGLKLLGMMPHTLVAEGLIPAGRDKWPYARPVSDHWRYARRRAENAAVKAQKVEVLSLLALLVQEYLLYWH